MELKFAPGCFDGLSEEEAKEVFDHVTEMFENGALETNSEPVDMDTLEEEDPELYAILMADMEKIDTFQ